MLDREQPPGGGALKRFLNAFASETCSQTTWILTLLTSGARRRRKFAHTENPVETPS